MNILNVNPSFFWHFALPRIPLWFTLFIEKIIQDFSPVFLLKVPRECQTGELAEALSQMLLQSARNITIEVLCEGKSKWAHTHKNIPLLLGRQPLAHCSLLVNRRALCFLQQEPAAGTCYCSMCKPKENLTISQMLREIQPSDSVVFCCFFSIRIQKLNLNLRHFHPVTTWNQQETFPVEQRLSRETGTLFLGRFAGFSHTISTARLPLHFV